MCALAHCLKGAYEHWTAVQMAQTIAANIPSKPAITFAKLSKLSTDKPVDHRRWLIGRLYMLAASRYILGALEELERDKLISAQQLCDSARQCLKNCIPHLPQWERSSAIGYIARLERVTQRIAADRDYAFIHLKALQFKVERHALYVPPEPK
ncbi:MAG: hypothetical protein GDYSWBUE_001840 [Candidatus Fervidibacterota bacterium]